MTKSAENLQQYNIRFSLIVEQILALASSTNLVREFKNMSPNSIRIAKRCFTLYITLIRIDRSFYRKTLISSGKNDAQIACVQLTELTFPYN